jgi:hypothetical protein
VVHGAARRTQSLGAAADIPGTGHKSITVIGVAARGGSGVFVAEDFITTFRDMSCFATLIAEVQTSM